MNFIKNLIKEYVDSLLEEKVMNRIMDNIKNEMKKENDLKTELMRFTMFNKDDSKPDVYHCMQYLDVEKIDFTIKYKDKLGFTEDDCVRVQKVQDLRKYLRKLNIYERYPSSKVEAITGIQLSIWVNRNNNSKLVTKYFISTGVYDVGSIEPIVKHLLDWIDEHPELLV